MIRCLIVDDEPLALHILEDYISKMPFLQLVKVTTNPIEALQLVQEGNIDLVFLDVQMPELTGIQFLRIANGKDKVILTTAYPQYALEGYELDVIDYLLKPIDPARLAAALARVKIAYAGRAPLPEAVLEQIFVRDGERCWFVPLREVRLLSSEGNYIRLSWGKTQPLLGRALAAVEPRLDPNRFFRANRRQILNLDFIEHVELGVNGRLHAQLRDGPEVEISRRQARLFKAKMSV